MSESEDSNKGTWDIIIGIITAGQTPRIASGAACVASPSAAPQLSGGTVQGTAPSAAEAGAIWT